MRAMSTQLESHKLLGHAVYLSTEPVTRTPVATVCIAVRVELHCTPVGPFTRGVNLALYAAVGPACRLPVFNLSIAYMIRRIRYLYGVYSPCEDLISFLSCS